MDRREFVAGAMMATVGMSFMSIPDLMKSKRMGIVVHSYASRWNSKVESKNFPGFMNAIDLLEHCAKIQAGGVQVGVNNWSQDFARSVRDRREKLGLYLEGSIGLPKKPEDVSAFEKEVISAREAGATVLRTVSLGGRRYETFDSLAAFQDFRKSAVETLQRAEPIVRKHKMKLAIENHKDWQADELATLIKQLNSEWVGVTLDFGNSIALTEEPMEVIKTLAPFIFSTHVKDMGVEEYENGFLLSEVALGKGLLDLPAIVSICKQHNPDVTFSLEMITRDPLEIPCLTTDYWKTFDNRSASELARIIQMVRKNKYKPSLPRVSQLTPEERLAAEEENIISCLAYSRERLGLV
jgi:sugar phosphate isomerase/epimerase